MVVQLRLALLGPFVAQLDGREITDFSYGKVRALLVYLAVEANRSHQREVLAGLLWPRQSLDRARANLRGALAVLRRVLNSQADLPFLCIEHSTLQFNRQSPHYLDVEEFGRLIDTALAGHRPQAGRLGEEEAGWLAQAVALYRGEFLEQAELCDGEEFEEWVQVQRERLHQRVVAACTALVAHYEALGHWEQVQRFARLQLRSEPWSERGHRSLMRALSNGGQRAEALKQYERCRRLLAERWGAEPEEATRALYEQIRAGSGAGVSLAAAPGPPLPEPGNLPIPVASFIGRQQQIAEAQALLTRPEVRLLTFSGTGGTGKTSLALAVAHKQKVVFPDGVWFVGLASLQDSRLVADAIAGVLGIKEAAVEPLLDRLAHFVRRRQMLLVLDNFEHLLEAAGLIGHLLARCEHLKVLVTSRVRLHLYGEWEYFVPPLGLPDSGDTLRRNPQRLISEAEQLFMARAQAAGHRFQLDEQSAQSVAAICTRLDGLPLAIELAAAQRSWSDPRLLLGQLADQFSVLVDGPLDQPDRHRTLRCAIEWSYRLLSAREQRLFRCLSVFCGSWTLAAARAVCGEDERTAQDLSVLLDHHLIHQQSSADGEQCFLMLQTLRAFAQDELVRCGEVSALQNRHAQYYLAFAESAQQPLMSAEQSLWVQRLAGNNENLRAALHWAERAGEAEILARMARALYRFWYVRGYLSEGRSWLEAALLRADALPVPLLAQVFYGAGILALRQADFEQAARRCEQARVLFGQLAEPGGLARAELGLGLAAFFEEDYSRSQLHLERSLAIGRNQGGLSGSEVTFALFFLAAPLSFVGQYDRARALIEEALTLSRANQDSFAIALCLGGIAQIEHQSGDHSQAERFYKEALALYRSLGAQDGAVSWILSGCAALALVHTQTQRAVHLYAAAAALREVVGASLAPDVRKFHEPLIASARADLGPRIFQAAWTLGSSWSFERAFSEVLDAGPLVSGSRIPP